MHELSLCEAIKSIVQKHADGHPVTQVHVRVGYLRQVVPDALQFNWSMVRDVPGLRDCTLTIEQIPAVVACRDCPTESTLDIAVMACANCGGLNVDLLSGEEFYVDSFDVVGAS